jgi:hypothetical protein
MPVGSTSQRSVQVLGFEEIGLLTPLHRLIRFLFVRPAFCLGLPSDSQSPTTPLPLANTSPCRVCRGLPPPSHQRGHHSQASCACAQRAMPGAPIKNPVDHRSTGLFISGGRGRNRTGVGGFAIRCITILLLGLKTFAVSSATSNAYKLGAGNETRTRDPDLGKVVLYQLSYSRVLVWRIL